MNFLEYLIIANAQATLDVTAFIWSFRWSLIWKCTPWYLKEDFCSNNFPDISMQLTLVLYHLSSFQHYEQNVSYGAVGRSLACP